MPPSLLGSGNLNDIETKFPNYEWPSTLKYYYLSTMGFHLFSFVQHGLSLARNDYMEMMLHHGATVLLYGLSYYCNRVESGAIIMFLHDWADIPTGFTRCFSETTFTNLSILNAVLMLVSWLYTRLIIFPQVIYATSLDTFEGRDNTFQYFTTTMLTCLLILHFYWFYVLFLAIKKYANHGKVVNM